MFTFILIWPGLCIFWFLNLDILLSRNVDLLNFSAFELGLKNKTHLFFLLWILFFHRQFIFYATLSS